MAMPENRLSFEAAPDVLVNEKDQKVTRKRDFELGGIAPNDPSEGLLYQEWQFYVTNDGTQIRLVGESYPDHLLYEGEKITEVSGSFDQNMRPTFVFVEDGVTKMEWYDSAEQDRVLTVYGLSGFDHPKVSMDHKQPYANEWNDVIFAYMNGRALYHRLQRDRYTIPYLLHPMLGSRYAIQCIGMSKNSRFTFCFVDERDLVD